MRTINEILSLVAQGRVVWPGIATTRGLRDDIVAVRLRDLPPLALALIWRTGRESTGIRALAEVARSLEPDRGVPTAAPTHVQDNTAGAVGRS